VEKLFPAQLDGDLLAFLGGESSPIVEVFFSFLPAGARGLLFKSSVNSPAKKDAFFLTSVIFPIERAG